ncbi:FAD-linked oxidase C-terminal domain-containing protein [Virgibacillus ainsalahensis]
MEIARKYSIPVTAYGAGSGLEGQAIPVQKGIVVNFENMNNVVEFSPEDLLITVQPGITRLQLNQIVNKHGLMFPIDPGADASIGGMVATNASGTTAVRYGSISAQLLNLEVVLANGSVIRTGSKARKSSSGYRLTELIAGSEGTLGLVTEITLKLQGIPEEAIAARCTFSTARECAVAAKTILESGIPVMRMELVDAITIKEVNAYGGYSFPVEHSLFLEFADSKTAVNEQVELVREFMYDLNCKNWEASMDSNQRAELWKARQEMSYAFRHRKGKKAIGGDVCVPISQIPELVVLARDLMEKNNLKGGVFGHIGDGNFHTLLVFDPTNQEEQQKAENINEALAHHAIAVGGTCTGEHGVGLGKQKFQEMEHGEALHLMKEIKQLFDPQGILNPGKIFI